jgi:hypothetical protein
MNKGQTTVKPMNKGQTTVKPMNKGQTTVKPMNKGQITVKHMNKGQTTVKPMNKGHTNLSFISSFPLYTGQNYIQCSLIGKIRLPFIDSDLLYRGAL